jgi:hypothetical protein
MFTRTILASLWIIGAIALTQQYIEPMTIGQSLPVIVGGFILWGAVISYVAVIIFSGFRRY